MSEEQPPTGGNGFLRRAVILIAFAILYPKLVLYNPDIIANPAQAVFLHCFTWAAIVWGIVSLLSDRIGRS